MKIFLVRHAESEANCNTKMHASVPDHSIALSSLGKEQAEYAGEFLKAYFEKEYADILDKTIPLKERLGNQLRKSMGRESNVFSGLHKGVEDIIKDVIGKFDLTNSLEEPSSKIKLYNSPYKRTRETAQYLLKTLKNLVSEVKEDTCLAELQGGLFDGLTEIEKQEKYPNEFIHYEKSKMFNGKFWAKYPHGESAFDVLCRLNSIFMALKEDELNGIQDVIIVGIELLETGKLNIKRYDAEELLSIRNGAWTYEQLIEFSEKSDKLLNELYKTSKLPREPDRIKINNWLIDVTEKYLQK